MALHNDVLKQQIWEWFCNDIDSCLGVAKDIEDRGERSQFKGALNFTAALTIFSVIELAAGFYVGGAPEKNDGIAKFIAKYIGNIYPKLADERVAKEWYEVFRNGLSHQWAPKHAGVSMKSDCKEVVVFCIPKGRMEEIPVLIVPALFEAVKAAPKKYEADLNSSDDLQEKFKRRHDDLCRKDREEMERLRQRLTSASCSPPTSATLSAVPLLPTTSAKLS